MNYIETEIENLSKVLSDDPIAQTNIKQMLSGIISSLQEEMRDYVRDKINHGFDD